MPTITCILIVLLALGCIVSGVIILKPQEYDLAITTMGDTSNTTSFAALRFLNSTISSAKVTVVKSDMAVTVDIYQSSSIPPCYYDEGLKAKFKCNLTGPYPYNYNYLDDDNPIYLSRGSSLAYNCSISQVKNTSCPARLFLFKNRNSYSRFIRGQMSDVKITDRSPCLFPKRGTWSFNISESFTYYVGIAINTGTTVNSSVTVNRVNYNTSGLQRSKQLTSTNPTDSITTCGSKFQCTGNDNQYLLVVMKNSTNTTVGFHLETFFVYGSGRNVLFTMLVIILLFLVIVMISVAILKRILTKCYNKKKYNKLT